MSDLTIERQGPVATVEIRRPPHNYFDGVLIKAIAETFEDLDRDPTIRCILLCSEGKNFCAGANFPEAVGEGPPGIDPSPVYQDALRLFRIETPSIAVVQGSAIGGGLGLALTADFRVASPQSRFSANFNRIGIHPGFGLSVTLPRLVGVQQAALLLYTGRRVAGDEAHAMGLADLLAEDANLRARALDLAQEIALSAPLAVASTRRTLRGALADEVASAVAHEIGEQRVHFASADFREGVAAMSERRPARFTGA